MALYPNKPPAMSFGGILNTISNGQLTDELQVIQDGMGNNSPISLSKTSFDVNRSEGSFFLDGVPLSADANKIDSVCELGSFSFLTSSMKLPTGNTAQRPGVASNGNIRYNSQTNEFEGYKNGAWVNFTTTPA